MVKYFLLLAVGAVLLPYLATAFAALFAVGPLVLVLLLLAGGLIKLADLY